METIYTLLKNSHPGATDDEIMEAVDKSRVIDFAWELRDGLQTIIGPDAYQLTPLQAHCMEKAMLLLRSNRNGNREHYLSVLSGIC